MSTTKKPQPPIVFLKGRRVYLRPLRKDTDLESCLRWQNDPDVIQWLPPRLPMTVGREEDFFASHAKDQNNIHFGIVLNRTDELIGTMGIHITDQISRRAVTGAVIGEERYRSKGYGAEAKELLLEYAFMQLNLHKVGSRVLATNARSLAYCKKSGYRVEGVLRQEVFKGGQYVDLIELAIFRDDWLKKKQKSL